MKRKTYSLEFKEQALRKALERGQHTLQDVADELNLSLGTLKNWLKEHGKIQTSPLPTNTLDFIENLFRNFANMLMFLQSLAGFK